MKRCIIIECDTEDSDVWVYTAEREFTAYGGSKSVAYYRDAGQHSLIFAEPGPKFYGKLDTLLITKDRIQNAPPITPEPPTEGVVQFLNDAPERVAAVLADQQHAGITDGDGDAR